MLSRLTRDESGFALVLALMAMVVLTIVGTTAIYYATQSQHESSYSKASSAAYRLAETGINNAMAKLNGATTRPLDDPNALYCSPPGSPTCTTVGWSSGSGYRETSAFRQVYAGVAPGATAKWWGILGATFSPFTGLAVPTWTIYGEGVVPNPTQNPSQVKRTVSASVVVPPSSGALNAKMWNFIYLTGTGDPSGCDTSFANSSKVDFPLYLEGNLCLDGSAKIREDVVAERVPISVTVRGWVSFDNSSTTIGVDPTNTVSAVTIGGGCQLKLDSHVPPRTHACIPSPAVNHDPLYVAAGGFSTSVATFTPPVTDWPAKYLAASPGPTHPCTTVSGTPPLFESVLPSPNTAHNTQQDLVAPYPNGSIPLISGDGQNLTPGASYTCKTATGELSWNVSTHTLTLAGAVYIDGGVMVGSKAFATTYNGLASLYVSGAIKIIGSVCALVIGTVCDTNWNPNTKMWVIAAHGVTSQDTSDAHSIYGANSANFQGAFFATGKVILDNGAIAEGPMIAGNLLLTGAAQLRPWPLITAMPPDAPTVPVNNTHVQPDPPTNFSDCGYVAGVLSCVGG
jgi:hypothetical protein